MMDSLRAKQMLDGINVAKAGQGDDKKNAGFMQDLKRRAQFRTPWDGEPQTVTVDGFGMSSLDNKFSTDEAYIDDDEWFGDDSEG